MAGLPASTGAPFNQANFNFVDQPGMFVHGTDFTPTAPVPAGWALRAHATYEGASYDRTVTCGGGSCSLPQGSFRSYSVEEEYVYGELTVSNPSGMVVFRKPQVFRPVLHEQC